MSDTKERENNKESWDSFSPAELHRVLFEESTDGMFITDPHWQCISANPSAAALTGHSIEELIGMTITDLIPPETLERDPILMEDLRKGNIVTSERLIRSKNGSLISPRDAVCLETQVYPNAMAHPHFPSPILRAGAHYHTQTIYRFDL